MSDHAALNREDVNREGAKRGLTAWFAGNHVAANVLMALLLAGGIFAATQIRIERFPDFDPRTITVTVPYPGAAPVDVEESITRRVEASVSGIVGVERMLSAATHGRGVVTLELTRFADAVDVLNAVRTAVERIEYFPPPGAEQPEIVRAEVIRNAVTLAVSSADLDEDGLRTEAETLQAALLAMPEVSHVALSGARDREIRIEVSAESLRRHGLTIDQVVARVGQSSLNLSAGELHTPAGDVVISTFAKRSRAEEFQEIVIVARADGSVVRLRDVSTIRSGFVETDLLNRIDDRPTIFVRVDTPAGHSTRVVAAAVRQFLSSYAPPLGADVTLWHDEDTLIREPIAAVAGNAVLGAVLVFLALLLIFDLRLALWIAVGIPVSFLGSLVFFDGVGLSLNTLTLFAFFLVTGIVVDDAVVVGESIARQRELGLRGAAASIAGVRAVAGPVAVGTATTVVTLFALFPLADSWGQIFRVVPVVVALVLAVSLLEAYCILPAHLAGARPWSLSPLAEFQTRVRAAVGEVINDKLVRAIAVAVRFPYLTVLAVLLSIALAAVLVATGVVGYTAFPNVLGSDRLTATVTMPPGTQFPVTEAAAEHLAAAARAADREAGGTSVESVAVLVGRHRVRESYRGREESPVGSHLASVDVKLNPNPVRSLSPADFERLWRRAAGQIPGVQTVSYQGSGELTTPTVAYVLKYDDQEVLARAVADWRSAIAAIDAIHEIDDSLEPGKRRYDLQLTPAGVAAGLTAAQVAGQLRDAFFGAEVQRIQRGNEEIRVVVRYPGERRGSVRDLLDERITTATGIVVPLSTVARITETRDYASLWRIDGRGAATVTGWYDSAVAGSGAINAELREPAAALAARYPDLEIEPHGTTREAERMARTLARWFALALLVVYGLLASQLRSFGQPLLALAGMALAAVGAVIGHFVLGYSLSTVSVFGIVAVTGVAVNDTLLLLDRYNQIRAGNRDLPAIAAISAAARDRARPILITTVTTVVGLLPMLYDKSEVIQFLAPMVLSLGAGLVFASLGVLFLVPAVVIIAEAVTSPSPRGRGNPPHHRAGPPGTD